MSQEKTTFRYLQEALHADTYRTASTAFSWWHHIIDSVVVVVGNHCRSRRSLSAASHTNVIIEILLGLVEADVRRRQDGAALIDCCQVPDDSSRHARRTRMNTQCDGNGSQSSQISLASLMPNVRLLPAEKCHRLLASTSSCLLRSANELQSSTFALIFLPKSL